MIKIMFKTLFVFISLLPQILIYLRRKTEVEFDQFLLDNYKNSQSRNFRSGLACDYILRSTFRRKNPDDIVKALKLCGHIKVLKNFKKKALVLSLESSLWSGEIELVDTFIHFLDKNHFLSNKEIQNYRNLVDWRFKKSFSKPISKPIDFNHKYLLNSLNYFVQSQNYLQRGNKTFASACLCKCLEIENYVSLERSEFIVAQLELIDEGMSEEERKTKVEDAYLLLEEKRKKGSDTIRLKPR
ncbi:MAG: hypothetical protein OEZ58_15800 [Gammaproteobacteria bacterium]|nr:hypothetical protein [Gammaproteobacteria bacterium]